MSTIAKELALLKLKKEQHKETLTLNKNHAAGRAKQWREEIKPAIIELSDLFYETLQERDDLLLNRKEKVDDDDRVYRYYTLGRSYSRSIHLRSASNNTIEFTLYESCGNAREEYIIPFHKFKGFIETVIINLLAMPYPCDARSHDVAKIIQDTASQYT